MTYVTSIRKSITIDLCHKVLESSMHDSPATTADNILTSLNLVLENTTTTGVDPYEELDQEELNEVALMPECDQLGEEEELTTLIVEDEPEAIDDDGLGIIRDESAVVSEDDSLPQSAEKFTRKKMHEFMLRDTWNIGNAKLKKMNVLYKRDERTKRLRKKARIRQCILNGIKDMIEQQSNIGIGEERGELSNWQRHTRNRQNNLNLK